MQELGDIMNIPHLISSPRAVEIALTKYCNLSCLYCSYADETVHDRDDLPTDVWVHYFKELEDCKVMNVVLTGGEIFCRDDVFSLIESIVQHKMRFTVLSNGTLITKDIASFLVNTKRFNKIQISVDGSNPNAQDPVCGEKSFMHALRGLRCVIEAGAPVTVRVTITPINAGDIKNICELLLQVNVKHFSVVEALPYGDGFKNNKYLTLSATQRNKLVNDLVDFDNLHPGVIIGQAGPLIEYKMKMAAINTLTTGVPFPYSGAGFLSGCKCANTRISVTHDGYYIPCYYLSSFKLGHIREHSLLEVWRNSVPLNRLRTRHRIPLKDTEFCKDCLYTHVCTGNCPGLAYVLTGDLDHACPVRCNRSEYERMATNER